MTFGEEGHPNGGTSNAAGNPGGTSVGETMANAIEGEICEEQPGQNAQQAQPRGQLQHSDGATHGQLGMGHAPPEVYCRNTTERPVYKLSVRLIDTYKFINKVYYEARAKKNSERAGAIRGGVYNDGYDDQHYDYILHQEEVFADRYLLRHRIGKGSFGQVVCAYDQVAMKEVAIKIIKSRRPFMLQAQTEISLLEEILVKDHGDEHNIVRMINKFVFRNHQCLVFEMLS
jgi:hypothetical protein